MKYDCFKNKVAFITGSTSGFGKATAMELAKFNIKVNTVSPALAIAPLTETIMNKEDFDAYAKVNPSGRVCNPQDVANAIVFLLSSDADYINVENVKVNGGILLK